MFLTFPIVSLWRFRLRGQTLMNKKGQRQHSSFSHPHTYTLLSICAGVHSLFTSESLWSTELLAEKFGYTIFFGLSLYLLKKIQWERNLMENCWTREHQPFNERTFLLSSLERIYYTFHYSQWMLNSLSYFCLSCLWLCISTIIWNNTWKVKSALHTWSPSAIQVPIKI